MRTFIYVNGHPQPAKFSGKKEKHLFTIHCGSQKATTERRSNADWTISPLKFLTVLVDYPPQVHALAWRLNKRCSSATGKLSLRNPNFYPHPFIEGLNDDSIGRPLESSSGQTYGLKPLAGEWTPRIEVYTDDPKGGHFKLEGGGFYSVFKGVIELENPKRIVFRGWCEFRLSELIDNL